MFDDGFRPLLALAGANAALGPPLGLPIRHGDASRRPIMPPVAWPGHEMIFGRAASAPAGFLRAAVANRAGSGQVRGARTTSVLPVSVSHLDYTLRILGFGPRVDGRSG
jgi:uncharacterized protein involved in response to NO